MNQNDHPVYVIEACERETATTQQRHGPIVKNYWAGGMRGTITLYQLCGSGFAAAAHLVLQLLFSQDTRKLSNVSNMSKLSNLSNLSTVIQPHPHI